MQEEVNEKTVPELQPGNMMRSLSGIVSLNGFHYRKNVRLIPLTDRLQILPMR